MFVGIDVSKDHLDVCTDPARPTSRRFNTPGDVESLAMELQQATLVIVEATGGYENILVTVLLEHGIPVARVNPRQVRDFASRITSCPKRIAWMRRFLAVLQKSGRPIFIV